MKCKKIYKYIAIVFMMFMLLIPNYVQAEDRMEKNIATFKQVFGEESIELEAVYGWNTWQNHDGSGTDKAVYQWNKGENATSTNNKLNPAFTVWHIVKKGTTSNFNKLLYCIRAGIGFETQENSGNGREPKTYNEIDDLEAMKTKCRGLFKKYKNRELVNLSEEELEDLYHELLWLFDNIYIPEIDDESKKETLINKAFYAQNPNKPEYPLSDIDIEIVQQMAIWYFTNSEDLTNYHLKDNTLPVLPAMYLNGTAISSIAGSRDDMGNETGGGEDYQKDLNILFQYLTTNAAANNTYTGAKEPNLTLNSSSAQVKVENGKYVAGPYTVTNSETDSGTVNLKFSSNNGVTVKGNSTVKLGEQFYVQVDNNGSNAGKTFNFKITYSYNVRSKELLLVQDDHDKNQPIVYVTKEQKSKSVDGSFTTSSETVSVKVKKTWDDSNDQDGKRPKSVSVQLLADKQPKDSPVTLNGTNWEYTWPNLPKYNDSGKEITYTVEEKNPQTGYTPSYKEEPDGTWTITNTYKPETTSVKVKKHWDDDDDRDAQRPKNVSVQLLADGEAHGTAVELNSTNSWEHTWNNLPKYKKR